VKKIMESWRGWLTNEDTLQLWSKATGISIEKLREGISRRGFLRGLGAAAGAAALPGAAYAHDGDTGDTGDTGIPYDDLWVPPDDDLRWGDSEWTALKGFALIDPELIEPDDSLAKGTWTPNEYKESLKNWKTEDLKGALVGQRATIVHGDPGGGHGLGLDRFDLDDDRELFGKIKLPLTWSLMYQEFISRRDENVNELFDKPWFLCYNKI